MRKLILILILLGISLAATAQNLPKREFRGAWLHIIGNSQISKMSSEEVKEWLVTTLDRLQSSGCNAVFFQVRPEADAFYYSEIEPWTRFLTGTQGQAPDPFWDPLEFMVTQCHSRGMEIHAWINPYRVTANASEKPCPEHLYWKKPEIFKTYGDQIFFDPGEPESREHILRVIRDIVGRYDIDGIHFDDYFYPYPIKGKEFDDDATFRKYGPGQGFGQGRKDDWRRNNTAVLIHEVNQAVKSIKPWMRFGVSPFGIHRNISDTQDGSGSRTNGLSCYHSLYADAPGWAKSYDVDYLAPQLYWKIGHKLADYEILANWWNELYLPGQLYVGQSIETLSEPDLSNPKTTQLARKIQITRELPDIDGNVWWPAVSLSDNVSGIADSLAVEYQRFPALIPAYTNIDPVCPDPVSDIWAQEEGSLIRWNSTYTDDPLQDPCYFVVYRFGQGEAVDIEDPSHIFALTRNNWIRVEKDDRHEYVVTVVDHCWNESLPSEAVSLKP